MKKFLLSAVAIALLFAPTSGQVECGVGVHWYNGEIVLEDVVSGSTDCTLKIWSLSNYQEIVELNEHHKGIKSIAIADDGKTIISASSDNTLRIWQSENAKSIDPFEGYSKTQ